MLLFKASLFLKISTNHSVGHGFASLKTKLVTMCKPVTGYIKERKSRVG